MERFMWRHVLSLMFRIVALILVILVPVWGCYELCRLAVPLGSPDQYADIPAILKGAVQSIPRIGNFLDILVSLLGIDFAPAGSLDFTILEEITYVLLLALFSPSLYKCYIILAGMIDELLPPYFDALNMLTDAIFGAGAVCGSVSLAMILRDTLAILIRPLGHTSWVISVATIIGLLFLITIVGSVAAHGNLPRKLLCGILNILLGILMAGCMALFSNALLLLSNRIYLTGPETAASIICLIATAASIFFIIYCYYRIEKKDA